MRSLVQPRTSWSNDGTPCRGKGWAHTRFIMPDEQRTHKLIAGPNASWPAEMRLHLTVQPYTSTVAPSWPSDVISRRLKVGQTTGQRVRLAVKELMPVLDELGREFVATSDPHRKRVAAQTAIYNLNIYFRNAFKIDPSFHSMLLEIAGDIENIDEGFSPSFLIGEKRHGRPPEPRQSQAALAATALVIDLLVEAGDTLRQAAQRVAREMENAGLPVPKAQSHSERPTAARLISWRKELRAAKPGEAKTTYDLLKDSVSDRPPREAAEALLRYLRAHWSKVE